ncbi:MAG TPA: hypothetical protein VFQ35_11075 [Polyangiaceae bacterium]|nr:hypothetical protein [Polyangiaceae bacterium]
MMVLRLCCATLVLSLGCHGSMSAEAKMGQELDRQDPALQDPPEKQGLASNSQPLSAEESARQAALAEPATNPDLALFGARHDFVVKDASGAVGCQCVSVLLGPPSSGKLEWRGEMPRTKPETQLVVALVPGNCPDGAEGASYWGYRVDGNDVVVLLEGWKPGRPRTLGAIVPRPAVGGQVYVAPVSSKLPYGKALAGGGARCAAGNPGPQRTTPLESSAPIP